MIKLKITNTETVMDNHENKIKLYGRDSEGRADSILVEGFPSRFYAPTEQVKDVQSGLMATDQVLEIIHNPDRVGLGGESLSRIGVSAPWDMKELVDAYGLDGFGSDVWSDLRLRIEKDLFTGVQAPSRRVHHSLLEPVEFTEPEALVAWVDIEISDEGAFVTDGSRKITSIVASDSYSEKVVGFIHLGPDRTVEECFPNGRPESVDELHYSTTEKTMLESFAEYIQEVDPDLLSGWNSHEFDYPYLYRRFEEIGLDPASLSREGFAKDRGYNGVSFTGRTIYDLMSAYDRTKQGELDSYRLDAIAQEELDDTKIEHTGLGYLEMWEQDPEMLVDYNSKDVTLCSRINEKAEVMSFWTALREELGLDFESTRQNNQFIESMARRDLKEHGIEGPATDYDRGKVDYEGGYVFPAHTGVEENVLAIDLASLYPLTLWMANASPETLVEPENVETLRRAGIDVCEAPNGAFFRLDDNGVFKRLVDTAIGLKADYKKKRNAATPGTEEHDDFSEKYNVSKTITNSVYGTAGWERFFLFNEKVAEAITLLGQEVIKKTAEYVNSETIGEVIYGDTDSCYIALPADWESKKCIEWGERICSELNDEVYPEFAQEFGIPESMNRWEIEPEALGTFFQAGKKKRYAFKAVWEDGHDLDEPEYTVKGFDSKRSDTAPLTEELQKNVFKTILDGADETALIELVQDASDEILDPDCDLEYIGIPGGIGQELEEYENEGAHVRGARYMNELAGTNIGQGDKPRRVYLNPTLRVGEGEASEKVDVISFEEIEDLPDDVRNKLEVDTAAMTEKILTKKMEPILSAVGTGARAAIRGQTQTGIRNFL